MILLGLNAGFGNTDVAELPLSVVRDAMRTGWISYTRGKTGSDRLAWLWPETRDALREYLAERPAPAAAEHADLLFLTRYGLPYVSGTKDQVSFQYSKLLERLGQVRTGRNFYSLRRTYRTVATETGKEIAIDLSMGHADELDDMAKVYNTGELRTELKKISEHVRKRFALALRRSAGARAA
jgi:integrase